MQLYYNTGLITNCAFDQNSATIAGGGLELGGRKNVDPIFVNCLFSRNTAGERGGALSLVDNANPTLINCTLIRNSAQEYGAVHTRSPAHAILGNCIVWANGTKALGSATITYSDVQGGFSGTGNIDADPLFVDPDSGDFRLALGSPCVDAGDNASVPADVDSDLAGADRFVDDPCVADTGNGDPPLVDMGAYEFQAGRGPCGLQVESFNAKYKDRIQGLRVKACLLDGRCEPIGAGWRLTFRVIDEDDENDVREKARVSRNSGCAVAKFDALTCGHRYRAELVRVQDPQGNECTPEPPPTDRQIIACLKP